MIRKKAKGKTAATQTAKKKKSTARTPKTKKQANAAEVRNDIAKIVQSGAKKITKAVMDQAMTGQLAPAKYLFEVAGVYPPSTDGSHATEDEDCFAKTLLDRLNLPDTPVGRDEEDQPAKAATPAQRAAADEEPSEKESNKQDAEQEDSQPEHETTGDASQEVSVLV
jgi:hypothetical protein